MWSISGGEPTVSQSALHRWWSFGAGRGPGWLELSWGALESWIKARTCPAVLLPIGAVEQHGPFLPLGTDLIITEHIAESIARQVDLMVAPSLAISASDTHLGFPGTLSLGATVLRDMLERLCVQLQARDGLGMKHGKLGFQRVFLLSAHGGNMATLKDAEKLDGVRALPGWWELPEARETIGRLGIVEGAHADETETSFLLHYGYAIELPGLPFRLPEESNDCNLDRPDTREISASGILAPGLYSPSAESGGALHEAAIRGYVRLLHADGIPMQATMASGDNDQRS